MRFRTTCVVPLPLKRAPCRAPWVAQPVNTRAPASAKHRQTMLADMGPVTVWACPTLQTSKDKTKTSAFHPTLLTQPTKYGKTGRKYEKPKVVPAVEAGPFGGFKRHS